MRTKTRRLLTLSLGGVLLLAVVASAGALLVLDRIRTGEAALRNRVLERRGWLEEIRDGIYLSGTLARDYFNEPHGSDATALLEKLKSLEQDTNKALMRYSHATPEGNLEVAQLRGEVATYWKVLGLMEEMAGQQSSPGVNAYFQRQLAQRRQAMLQIAGDINRALERDLEEGEAHLAAMYTRFRFILMLETVLILAFGSVLSITTIRRIVKLQTEARALSAQLVTSQEQERREIARELHDTIGQAASGIRLDLGRMALTAGSDAMRLQLQSAAAAAEQIVDSVRQIALSLRPSMLDDLGLVPALEWQAREVGNRTGLNVQVTARDSAGELPDTHSTCIYRVAQEALQNCARHSAASHVRVGLEKNATKVSLQIEDDGKGFLVGRTKGLGLLGIEERVGRLGGRFRVQSEPGRGTIVTAELPL